MSQRGFLVMTRDDALGGWLVESLQSYGIVRAARELRDAFRLLGTRSCWCGMVVDLCSLGGNPLPELERLREASPLLPTLALASAASAELVNVVHGLRGELVIKPVAHVNVATFAQRALACGWLPDERISAWVNELSRRHGLTSREVQLVPYALGNESREQVLRRLGITENTLKTQVRALLRKCGSRSIDNLAKNVLREALLFEVAPV